MNTEHTHSLTVTVSPDTRSALMFLQNVIEQKTGSKPSRQIVIRNLINAAYRQQAA
ncbi:hypothetical protein IWQ48_004223 [Labrenzia sp. EL_13]|nr:hypothetical protein [Labrenzia sp. EL_13]